MLPFTFQVSTTVRAGLGRSQELGTPSEFPTGMMVAQSLELLPVPSWAYNSIKVELTVKLGLEFRNFHMEC